jgi:hypothetical protein
MIEKMETVVDGLFRKWITKYLAESHPKDGRALLIQDLLSKPESPRRNHIIIRCIDNVYSDFHSGMPLPVHVLLLDLKNAGYTDLALKVPSSCYDHD